jgi:hypothetical protein
MRRGLWCPWAEVLCVACHDAKHPPVTANAKAAEPAARALLDRCVTFCDECHEPIVVRGDVAILRNVKWIADASDTIPSCLMEQTGGMCAALVFALGDSHVAVVTEAEPEPGFDLGLYTERGWHGHCDEESESIEFEGAEDADGAIALIMEWLGRVTR